MQQSYISEQTGYILIEIYFFSGNKKTPAKNARSDKGIKKPHIMRERKKIMVGEDGFEPSKLEATDLQSAPFGHSGTLPYYFFQKNSIL